MGEGERGGERRLNVWSYWWKLTRECSAEAGDRTFEGCWILYSTAGLLGIPLRVFGGPLEEFAKGARVGLWQTSFKSRRRRLR